MAISMVCGVRLHPSRLSYSFCHASSGKCRTMGAISPAGRWQLNGEIQVVFDNASPPTRWHMQFPGRDFFQVAVPKSFSRCLTVEGVEDSRAGTTDSLGKMVLRYSCKGLESLEYHSAVSTYRAWPTLGAGLWGLVPSIFIT